MLAAASSAYKHSLKVSPEDREHRTVEAFGERRSRVPLLVRSGPPCGAATRVLLGSLLELNRQRYGQQARRPWCEAGRCWAQPTCLLRWRTRPCATTCGPALAHCLFTPLRDFLLLCVY